MLIGVSFYAFMVSNVIGLLSHVYADTNKAQAKMDQVKSFLDDVKLPETLRHKVLAHYRFVQRRHADLTQDQTEALLAELPTQLRDDVALWVYRHIINKSDFLKRADPAFVSAVVPQLKPLMIPEGEHILHQDWRSNDVYFLVAGRAEQVSRDGTQTYRLLVEGSYFGQSRE